MDKVQISLKTSPEKAAYLLQPCRPIICTTINEDGSDHVAPFGWVTPISYQPPRLVLNLLRKPEKQHSLINIERTREFVVNLPDMRIADELIFASYDPQYGENKFERAAFTRIPAQKVAPPAIKECRAHLECRVLSIFEPPESDCTMLISDVLAAYYDSDAFSENMLINLRNFEPCLHLMEYAHESIYNSQTHVFMGINGSYTAEVKFPTKEEVKQRVLEHKGRAE